MRFNCGRWVSPTAVCEEAQTGAVSGIKAEKGSRLNKEVMV
jgi:hypothetical protein